MWSRAVLAIQKVQKLRVLFVAPYVPDALRTRPYFFLKNLCRRHFITLLAPVFGAEDQAAAQRLQPEIPGLEILTFPVNRKKAILNSLSALPRLLPMQSRFCYSAALVEKTRELWNTGRYDIVHVEHFRAAYVLGAMLKMGAPVVFESVDCISLLVKRTLLHGPLKNRVVSLIELWPSQRYEKNIMEMKGLSVVATSGEDANALEELAGQPPGTVKVIPNGVDLNYFSNSVRKREPGTVVFSGKMSYHANIAAANFLVKKVWPLVRERCPQAHLQIVGSQPPAELVALSVQQGVEVTGFVPELRDYLQKATVALAPMVYSVGIQNKVLEAMACGNRGVQAQTL